MSSNTQTSLIRNRCSGGSRGVGAVATSRKDNWGHLYCKYTWMLWNFFQKNKKFLCKESSYSKWQQDWQQPKMENSVQDNGWLNKFSIQNSVTMKAAKVLTYEHCYLQDWRQMSWRLFFSAAVPYIQLCATMELYRYSYHPDWCRTRWRDTESERWRLTPPSCSYTAPQGTAQNSLAAGCTSGGSPGESDNLLFHY